MKKVFIIGYNRIATKAIHELFKRSGYLSAHYSLADIETGGSIIIAEQMKQNLKDYKPLLHGMDHLHVFSDMFWHREDTWIDGIKYYHELYCDYPDAYFIMNTRNMDEWLESKRNHKKGAYIKRCMEYHGMDTEEDMQAWFFQDRIDHENEVRRYFTNNERFLEFDVDTEIDKLIEFVKPDFFLKKSHWVRV